MIHPNFELPFQLLTDGCKDGISFILQQEGRVIHYGGRSLKGAEKAYSPVELESLAVAEGTKYFRHCLNNSKFTLITDASALKYIFQKTTP